VTRNTGFVWFTNMRCDIVKANRLKPFDKAGGSTVENVESSTLTCTRALAIARSKMEACENTTDVSEECEVSERHCRGMQWLPILSPLLLVASTLFGWTMFAWLIAEGCRRKAFRVSSEPASIDGEET
jgi:hypothetical protein